MPGQNGHYYLHMHTLTHTHKYVYNNIKAVGYRFPCRGRHENGTCTDPAGAHEAAWGCCEAYPADMKLGPARAGGKTVQLADYRSDCLELLAMIRCHVETAAGPGAKEQGPTLACNADSEGERGRGGNDT